jgi:sulfur-oxidizing protein SoxY
MTPRDRSRRRLLLGAGAAVLLGRTRLEAQSAPGREHRLRLEVPILAEEPTAVPVTVGVDHPMEADHFIRWIEVTAEQDPVPDKGRFSFTPGSGRAWAAFTMRSGAGGTIRATAECSRHGRFTVAQEFRVADGGCTTPPVRTAGERTGHPVIQLPQTVKAGEIIEVRARVDHGSYTGLALRGGKVVREAPEYYVRQMLAYWNEDQVAEFRMTSAISPNPLVRFTVRVPRGGTLRVAFVNSEGQRWETSRSVQV